MTKYKAIICDIDGTLTPDADKQDPSKEVINAIKRAEEKGIVFCIATARSLIGAQQIIKTLDLKTYGILNNGATIYELNTRKPLWGSYINSIEANRILKLLEGFHKQIKTSTTQGLLINVKTIPEDLDIAKITIFEISEEETNQLVKEIEQGFDDIHAIKTFSVNGKDRFVVNITNTNATKQTAIKKLSEVLKIDTKQMIGIGDNYNDFPLLMACGFRVAMGNAIEDLKAIADYIAPPVEANGVADVINKFILS